MAVEKNLKETESGIITAPKTAKKGPPLSVEHFMALVEHKPHQSMIEIEHKQDGYFYRLVKNNPHRIRRYEALGYKIVKDSDDAKTVDSGQPDGRRIVGANELVLMKQPEEYHVLHQQALRAKAQRTQRGPVESFKTKASEFGVEVVDKMRQVRGPLEMEMSDDDD